jgi:hypothetical protein
MEIIQILYSSANSVGSKSEKQQEDGDNSEFVFFN